MTNSTNVIWQLVDSRNPGGIESHILELCSGLKEAGHKVKVVFYKDYGPHLLHQQLKERGLSFKCLDGTLSGLWHALKTERPLVVHTHGYKAGILGRMFARMQKTPVISTHHAGEKTKGKLALYGFLDRLSAPLATPIAVSRDIAKTLPANTHHMNNFVSIPSEIKVPFKGNVAFVGRLSEEKGPDIFCEIAKENPDLSFHIFGDGPMRETLENRYGNIITFHGQVDMAQHWDQIDLLCMPSRFEGLPMAALEAMARRIPVLASDAGGLPGLIDHTQSGWVIPLNQRTRYHQALKHWKNMDPRLRRIMGGAARNKVKSLYSPEAIIPKITTLYHEAAQAIR